MRQFLPPPKGSVFPCHDFMKNKEHISQKNSSSKNKSIGLYVVIIITVVMVAFVALALLRNEGRKQDVDADTIEINILSASLVEDTQYNIWFDMTSQEAEGSITLIPTSGVVLMISKTDATSSPIQVETIESANIAGHSFVWVVDKKGEVFFDKVDLVFESATQKDQSSIYVGFENTGVAFLSREEYDYGLSQIDRTHTDQP